MYFASTARYSSESFHHNYSVLVVIQKKVAMIGKWGRWWAVCHRWLPGTRNGAMEMLYPTVPGWRIPAHRCDLDILEKPMENGRYDGWIWMNMDDDGCWMMSMSKIDASTCTNMSIYIYVIVYYHINHICTIVLCLVTSGGARKLLLWIKPSGVVLSCMIESKIVQMNLRCCTGCCQYPGKEGFCIEACCHYHSLNLQCFSSGAPLEQVSAKAHLLHECGCQNQTAHLLRTCRKWLEDSLCCDNLYLYFRYLELTKTPVLGP